MTVFSTFCLASTARSDVLDIVGQASGSFAGNKSLGLVYSGTGFTAHTNAAGNAYGIDLGTFTYTAPPVIYSEDSTTFTSAIKITTPLIAGQGSQNASVDALAILWAFGKAEISFPSTPLLFNFTDSQGSGSFQLTLRDVTVWDLSVGGGGEPAHLWGDITHAVRVSVAEPFPVELLLGLLVGSGYALKRRVAHSG